MRPISFLILLIGLAGCSSLSSLLPATSTPWHAPATAINQTPGTPVMITTTPSGSASDAPHISTDAWLMFQHDRQHSGFSSGVGNIDPAVGPHVRWTYQAAPVTSPDMRWISSFPLGDLDGDGTLEVVVTTPDGIADQTPHVIALKDAPGENPPVRVLWDVPIEVKSGGVDQTSAALVDANGDGLLDVVFSAGDGVLRALRGTDGSLIWQHDTGRRLETGPVIADLENDGSKEIIQAADCLLDGCPAGGALFVFAARSASGTENPPLWSVGFDRPVGPMQPAVADLDLADGANQEAIITGHGAMLTVLWRFSTGDIVRHEFDIRALDPSLPADLGTVAISSTPVMTFLNQTGQVAVFAWMPDPGTPAISHVSAVALNAHMPAGEVTFDPLWKRNDNVWQSSPAVVPSGNGVPVLIAGTGFGVGEDGSAGCATVTGGVVAFDLLGASTWAQNFTSPEGAVGGSAAVADLNGDGKLEAVIALGCGGRLMAFDALTGARAWSFPLGDRTYGSPSIGDLDGDGFAEIVIGSYDGMITALGGE
jgi:outer membrane protein assembly factor BamB